MKGAYVVSRDPDLISRVVRAAAADARWAGGEVVWSAADEVMLRDTETGGQFLMYVSPIAFEDDGVATHPRQGVVLPEGPELRSYLVECRWEEQFARTARAVAGLSDEPAWVVDGAGVAWDASRVDPGSVSL